MCECGFVRVFMENYKNCLWRVCVCMFVFQKVKNFFSIIHYSLTLRHIVKEILYIVKEIRDIVLASFWHGFVRRSESVNINITCFCADVSLLYPQ